MKILKEILSLPTAPFHEEAVARYIIKFCVDNRLDLKTDKFGNLIVHYRQGFAKQPVILTAHMDHPGFEVLAVKGNIAEVGILGGINLEHFAGAKVLIKTSSGIVKGVVSKKPLKKKWHGKPIFNLWGTLPLSAGDTSLQAWGTLPEGKCPILSSGDFGWYDLPNVRIKDGLIYTKAADNLVSTASLIELLQTLVRKKVVADVRCVFTRAEEVGFVGCIALSEENNLPKNIPVIVLECSSASAGKVDIGGGPVIRVGDKLSCYMSEVDCWLKKIANDLGQKNKKFRFQRALLSGGTCEASVWTLKKRANGGLAFPLGNYHNIGPKGYAPEFVSVADHKWMQEFLLAIVSAGKYANALADMKRTIWKNYRSWKQKLVE